MFRHWDFTFVVIFVYINWQKFVIMNKLNVVLSHNYLIGSGEMRSWSCINWRTRSRSTPFRIVSILRTSWIHSRLFLTSSYWDLFFLQIYFIIPNIIAQYYSKLRKFVKHTIVSNFTNQAWVINVGELLMELGNIDNLIKLADCWFIIY